MNKATEAVLEKQLLDKKEECYFNWKLASTYWDRWRLKVE